MWKSDNINVEELLDAMDEELAEEDGKNRKDRLGFDVILEPPRHDQVIYLTESNLLYTNNIIRVLLKVWQIFLCNFCDLLSRF